MLFIILLKNNFECCLIRQNQTVKCWLSPLLCVLIHRELCKWPRCHSRPKTMYTLPTLTAFSFRYSQGQPSSLPLFSTLLAESPPLVPRLVPPKFKRPSEVPTLCNIVAIPRRPAPLRYRAYAHHCAVVFDRPRFQSILSTGNALHRCSISPKAIGLILLTAVHPLRMQLQA